MARPWVRFLLGKGDMRTISTAWAAAVWVLSLCGQAGAVRPWPDTSSRIGVFADQLPGSLTAAQRQFAATNLAGTQKQRASDLAALRVYNTNFLCLHYQLAVGQGPELFIDGDAWVSDWTTVNAQTNWFLLNAQTQRVYQTSWNWYLMDLRHTNGTPLTGWPQYWITTCVARMKSTGSDAVFADSYTQDAYSFGACNPTHPWMEDIGLLQANWIPQLEAFGRAITNAFAADTNGFLYLPNLGGLVTGWETMNYGVGHGGMIEGFCYWSSGSYFDPADWRLQMTRALGLVRSNKIVICQSYPDTAAVSDRLFALASYLLIKGSRTYLCLLTTGDVALEYYPEYTLSLGGATAAPLAHVTNYFHAPWGVYRRAYSNGWALVNPGETAVTIPNLGTNLLRAVPSGGGAVGGAGSYGGTLGFLSVTGLTVAAHGGEVLLFDTNAPAGGGASATNLAARHHSGQTFITWTERGDVFGERYRVYRHTSPIAATNLAQAARLCELAEGSAHFYANRYNVEASGSWAPRYTERFVVSNGAPQLAAGTGLLVWTLDTNDFAGGVTGSAFYAVTLVTGGVEDTGTFSGANTRGPVAEGVADPLPVLVTNFPATSGGGVVNIYIQYMDLRRWNPTFHAPHGRNGYYGLNNADPAVTGSLQYAYDYAVVLPSCPAAPAPAYIRLHGWAGGAYDPVTSDPDPYDWCAYKIVPYDLSETWFFGFARDCDFRTGAEPTNGAVGNYTEQRVLRMLYDLIRAPPAAPVDTNRLYVFGSSMGGSGTLAFALRYPNVFAAAYASQPMTDYATSGDAGGTDWRGDVEWKWGSVARNLPVVLAAPGDWGQHLQAHAGTGVWDWQDHQQQIAARAGAEYVPFGIGHGTNDFVIEWPTQGAPVYPALDGARVAWGGAIIDAGHSWMGWNGLPPTIGVDGSLAPFRNFTARKDESVPGLSRGSADVPLPVAQTGGFNQDLDWSASWYDWDGPVLDVTNRWQASLRSLNGTTQSVDVTPRRLTRFPKQAGARVLWRNFPAGSTNPLQRGQLAADSSGLLTITGLLVTPAGNRLQLDLDSRVDSDGDGAPDYWESGFAFATNNPADGGQDADGDHVLNRDEYRAGTDPRSAASVLAITDLAPTGLTWNATRGFSYMVETAPQPPAWPALRQGITATADRITLPLTLETGAVIRVAVP
jgi:hypothetical protein